jgi:hypothetical protein
VPGVRTYADQRFRPLSLPRLRMKTVASTLAHESCGQVRTLHGSFAGCRAFQVALVGCRCPEGHPRTVPRTRDGWLVSWGRSLAASLRLAACLRGVAFSSRSSLAWPSSCHELRPPSRVTTFRQAQVVLESKGFSPGRSALFRNGCYTAGRIGAPLLGVPALQGLTGRSCCGFRRCSPLALGRAAQADAGASGYRRIVQRRWNP